MAYWILRKCGWKVQTELISRISQAQEDLYNERWHSFYSQRNIDGTGEGIDRPVRYGVWVVVGEYMPQGDLDAYFARTVYQD